MLKIKIIGIFKKKNKNKLQFRENLRGVLYHCVLLLMFNLQVSELLNISLSLHKYGKLV